MRKRVLDRRKCIMLAPTPQTRAAPIRKLTVSLEV